MLLQRFARGRAIGEKNVGASLCHMPGVAVAAGGRLLARWSARELQGLILESGPGTPPQPFGFAEYLEGVVAGWIGFGRGRAELDLRFEHSVQQIGRCDPEPRPDQR